MNQLPCDLVEHVFVYLDGASYLSFTSTNKLIRGLRLCHMRWQNVHVNITEALHNVIDCRRNLLLHGAAGCSKSYTLEHIFDAAKRRNMNIAMTSTTAISALNFREGRTLHAFAQIGKGTTTIDQMRQLFATKPRTHYMYKNLVAADILVIDEISMLGCRTFELIDFIAKTVRNNEQPFGGIQVVMSGDFLQLSPVADRFVFMSPIWQQLNVKYVAFGTAYRQQHDRAFFNMLQRIRYGVHSETDIELLSTRLVSEVPQLLLANVGHGFVPPIMFSRHKDADNVNLSRLQFVASQNPRITITHHAALDTFMRYANRETGYITLDEPLDQAQVRQQNATLLETLEHKLPNNVPLLPNVQYIITFNISRDLINGTKCILRQNDPADDQYLELENGKHIKLQNALVNRQFIVNTALRIMLVRVQYAMRLGYAVTIHSSQGQTLNHIAVDLGAHIFASGQCYVALSRVRTLDGLYLLNFDASKIKAHIQAQKFVQDFEKPEFLKPTNRTKRQKFV